MSSSSASRRRSDDRAQHAHVVHPVVGLGRIVIDETHRQVGGFGVGQQVAHQPGARIPGPDDEGSQAVGGSEGVLPHPAQQEPGAQDARQGQGGGANRDGDRDEPRDERHLDHCGEDGADERHHQAEAHGLIE